MLGDSYKQLVGKGLGITAGELFVRLGISGKIRVVPIVGELSTKLSTAFSPRVAEIYPTIHRPYYCYYFTIAHKKAPLSLAGLLY